ncbi:serine protease grass-like [Musca vetustissima]|uniref:serine protease grass-like n=1 Tax=Musca vetustissima TaxID=27455 RepID=UPI002AB799AF|nr:serine protease grass-like [Musca vetustissima]
MVLVPLISQSLCEYGDPCTTPDNVAGICVPVKSCQPAFEFFTQLQESGRVITPSERDEIQSLHCGTFRNLPHVCCATSKVQLNPDGMSVLQRQTCGVYPIRKVTYGHEARLMGFPWMALLVYDDERDPYKCGGSIISEQYVLTAAHCVKGRERTILYVRLGEHRKSTPIDCVTLGPQTTCAPAPVEVRIAEFIIHPKYRSVYNDIALLRLERKVEPDRHIKPICLPIYDNLRTKENEQYVLSGWGRTETGNSSDVLRVAIIPQVDLISCQNQLRPFGLTYQLDHTHICAGAKNLVDACKGDSGGPIGYTGIYNEWSRFIQYGVVTVGVSNCGETNVPGIYANVSHYMQWITDHIRPE